MLISRRSVRTIRFADQVPTGPASRCVALAPYGSLLQTWRALVICLVCAPLLFAGLAQARTSLDANDSPCSAMSGDSVTLQPSGLTFSRSFFDPSWEVKNVSVSVCDYRTQSFRPSQVVGYQGDGVLVSYFVYNNGLSPGQIDEKSIFDEMSRAVRGIYEAKGQGIYTAVVALDQQGNPVDSPPLIRIPVGETPLLLCRFRLTLIEGQTVDSAVIVSAGQGAFLKCRLTMSEGLPHGEEILDAAVKRLQALVKPAN